MSKAEEVFDFLQAQQQIQRDFTEWRISLAAAARIIWQIEHAEKVRQRLLRQIFKDFRKG